ncbi:MAG: hypothetical protein H6719_10930 [Sandaracinaceae bacterium]|nr:hypothetical protein [Sandaracinaceae bacterium]
MASTRRQRRIAAAIVFSTLGLTGLLVAQGSTKMLAASVLPLDSHSVEPLGAVRPTPPETIDPTPVLRRNMFDHETGRLDIDEPPPEEIVEDDTPPEEVDPNAPPPPCDGSMRLVGAFVRMRNEEDSFAAITSASGVAMLYQSGMEVDGREIVSIVRNRVILRPRGGNLCSLSMFAEEGAPQVATAPAPSPAAVRAEMAADAASSGGMDQAALDNGITKVSERQYTIERSLVDRLLANQAALMRTARVIPHEEGGRVVGVKLYGIRRSSLLGRLGIQNGDMLRTINGYDMTAPDSALEAYARLRAADRITINLQRRGSDQTIDYQIR